MPLIPQAPSSYAIEPTCQIENLGWLLEQLPWPFGGYEPQYKGRFVEVGAFDGPTYSNTWQFVKAGWLGIMIEPMPDNVKLLLANLDTVGQHCIIVEPVACSNHDGILPMHFEREGSRESNLMIQSTNGANALRYEIRCQTLDDILRRDLWAPDFDLLVIDTEDHEQQVLNGFDLQFWYPKLAIIETHGWQRERIHDRFLKLYRIYSEDGLNTLFVRRDWCP